MNIPDQLASSLGRRDEEPNILLAQTIAAHHNVEAVNQLVGLLGSKDKNLQNDSIKVLYEAGALNPALISGETETFVTLLQSRNNRLQWGAMTALQAISRAFPERVFKRLPELSKAAASGSVITNDQFVLILVNLSSHPAFGVTAFDLLNEQLLRSPQNQLPMYAEQAMAVITGKRKAIFARTLASRLDDFDKPSKRRRVERVLEKISRS